MSIEITFTDGTIEVIADVHWIEQHSRPATEPEEIA